MLFPTYHYNTRQLPTVILNVPIRQKAWLYAGTCKKLIIQNAENNEKESDNPAGNLRIGINVNNVMKLRKQFKGLPFIIPYSIIFDKSSDLTMLYASSKLDKSSDVLKQMGYATTGAGTKTTGTKK